MAMEEEEEEDLSDTCLNPRTWLSSQILPAHLLYEQMQQSGITPNKYIYPATLKVCGDVGELKQGRILHDHVLRHGLESDIFIGSALVDLYCKCGSLDESSHLFHNLPIRNVVTWGALISGYAQYGYGESASQLFARMKMEGIKPNKVVFLSILKAFGASARLQKGRLFHDEILRSGFEKDLAVANMLIFMYSRGGNMEEAYSVFRMLRFRNVVSWGTLLSGYMQQDQGDIVLKLIEKMDLDGIKPNTFVFSCILKACGGTESSKQGKSVHDQIIRNKLETDTVLSSCLIDMYSEKGILREARYVFDKLKDRNIVAWNVMMCGYVHHGHSLHALSFFAKMNQEGTEPNKATYLYLLQACGDSGGILEGNMLHGHIVESATIVDVIIGSSLIDMYTKCGGLEDAHEVFCRLSKRNVISWSAIIRGYAYHGHHLRSLELFERMKEEDIQPDKVTFLCALKAIGNLRMMIQGTLIHDSVILIGLESDVMIGNGLMHMYCSCSSFESACKVFDNMPHRDVVSWSAMITGHAAHGDIAIAFGLFKRMQQEKINPDRVTLLCMVKACGIIGALDQGKLIHDYIQHNGADLELAVGNALVDMYARCGSLEDSSRVFHNLSEPDIISWGAMIAGYAEHGSFDEAWECMQAMEKRGLVPNGIMFTSILSACGRSGNIKTGHLYFRLMIERYGIIPTFEHVNCMGDLFGHAGCLEDAMQLLQCMPNQPDLTGWMSLLTACRTHGNREVGKKSFYKISEQDLSYGGGYDFMADIYADGEDSEVASKIQELRSMSKAWKKPGKAWMEIGNNIYEFIVGDKTHPRYEDIRSKLESLSGLMKKGGYLPQLDAVTHQFIGKDQGFDNGSETQMCTNRNIFSNISKREEDNTFNVFRGVPSMCMYVHV